MTSTTPLRGSDEQEDRERLGAIPRSAATRSQWPERKSMAADASTASVGHPNLGIRMANRPAGH